jgi:micrococcal nuclease
MYEYKAVVKKVVDGDTVDVTIDLGFNVQYTERVRLARINAPEMSTEAGKVVKTFMVDTLEGRNVTIKTEKNTFDKYGRWIAEVYYNEQSINQLLLDKNMAVLYGK